MENHAFELLPFAAVQESEDEDWEFERGRSRAAKRRRSPPRPTKPQMGSSGGSRRRPRLGRSIVGAPPCVCPAHGTEFVRWVQSTLNQIDGAGLRVTGVMDAAARNALRKFQRSKGLPVDGIAGPDTEQALRDARRPANSQAAPEDQPQDAGEVYEFETLELESPPSTPTLRLGSRGSAVSDLQRRLAAAGFSAGAADGIFGANTDAAVRAFQRARGLGVDGIVGAMTWSALLNATPIAPAPAPDGGSWGGGRGAIRYGKGWDGSEGVADAAKAIAASMGIRVTSEKRNDEDTERVKSSKGSDHYTGNKNAFATDFGVSGSRGDQLANAIAAKYGIPPSVIGTYAKPTIPVGDRRYRLQLLWKVDGHFNHVHLGIRRA